MIFDGAADYIEKQVIQTAGGNWLCIVGKRGLFDSNHEAKLSEYLMFSISHIQVQLLKLPDASSSASSASPIVCPPPATAPTSCQVQLNSAAKGKVKRSSMSAEQRADTLNYIKTALNEYAGSAEGVQYVCPYVTNELAIAHGSYQWACVAGLSSAYQFTHTVARPVQLQVQFDALHVQVLQLPTASGGNTLPSYPTPPPQPPLVCPPVSTVPNRPTTAVRTLLTQYDVLAAAREQLNPKYVHINETRMAGQMQARALNIVFDAVATEGTYESVARKMRDLAAQAFGNYWTATVGTDTQYWSYFHLTEPYFINLKIDRLRVLLYRQIMYRVG